MLGSAKRWHKTLCLQEPTKIKQNFSPHHHSRLNLKVQGKEYSRLTFNEKAPIIKSLISPPRLNTDKGKRSFCCFSPYPKRKKSDPISTTDNKIKLFPGNRTGPRRLSVLIERSSTFQAKEAASLPQLSAKPAAGLKPPRTPRRRPPPPVLFAEDLPRSAPHLGVFLSDPFSFLVLSQERGRQRLIERNCSPSSPRPAAVWAGPPCSFRKLRRLKQLLAHDWAASGRVVANHRAAFLEGVESEELHAWREEGGWDFPEALFRLAPPAKERCWPYFE